MEKDFLKKNKNKSQKKTPLFFRLQCPNCSKLFSVNETHIVETRPEFSCTICKTLFWISYPECLREKEVIGISSLPEILSQKESLKTLKIKNKKNKLYQLPNRVCPKCNASFKWGEKECYKCGLVFDKHYKSKEPQEEITAHPSLPQLWKDILKDYENQNLHQKFLETCRIKKDLPYSLHKYKKLLSLQPNDFLAQKYIKQIEALLSLTFLEKPLPSRKKKHLPWNLLLPGLSLGFVITGFMIPPLINLVGLGISLMFFSFSLRCYFQRLL